MQTLENKSKFREFLPLILVLSSIFIASFLWTNTAGYSLPEFLRRFMGIFFLTFGFFKTLDWKGFAGAYAEYDVIAKRSMFYSYIYPAIELALGVFYLTSFSLVFTNIATLVIMSVSSVGVINALLDKQRIPCACLGTVVKLPMTTITVIEDLGMAVMALIMLLI